MDNGILYVGILFTIIVLCLMVYDCLLILQQNHYHLSFIYKYLFSNFKKFDGIFIFISLLRFINFKGVYVLLDLVILVFYIYYFVYWLNKKRIIKLKFTNRIWRIIIVDTIINLFLITFVDYRLIIIFNVFCIYFSVIILIPFEWLINYRYISKARKKIDNIKPLIIGITGSAGKTSVKHFLYQLLKEEKVTFMSPKSYNTVMGLTKAINEQMLDGTEVAILEYGASKKGDIDKLLKVVKPDIGIITNILPQHLETFKSIENIMKEKIKLLNASRVAIYNSDLIDTIINDNVIRITVSEKKDSEYVIKSKSLNVEGCKFNINGLSFKSFLIGKCNYENILLSIVTCLYLQVNQKNLIINVRELKAVENRLEIINHNDKVIINDSFNSNIKGFKNALEVLSLYASDKKVIITPGIVECGKKSEEINSKISRKIIENCKECSVYIIKSNVSKYIKTELESNGVVFEVFNDFKVAYQKALKNFDVILIENDISDIYK